MKVEINISLTLNGNKQELSYDEAKKLYDELGKIFKKEEKSTFLHYPPGVRGGIMDTNLAKKNTYIDDGSGIPITAKLGDDENNMNPSYGGISEFKATSRSGSIKAKGIEDSPCAIPDDKESARMLVEAQKSVDLMNNRVSEMDEIISNMTKLTK